MNCVREVDRTDQWIWHLKTRAWAPDSVLLLASMRAERGVRWGSGVTHIDCYEQRPPSGVFLPSPGEVHRGETKMTPKIGRSPSDPAVPTN